MFRKIIALSAQNENCLCMATIAASGTTAEKDAGKMLPGS